MQKKLKNKKLILVLKGGLGNQLFAYSCAKRLALKCKAELVIDDTSGFVNDKAYKRTYQLKHFNIPHRIANHSEKLIPFSRVRRKIIKIFNLFLPFSMKFYIEQEFISYDQRIIDKKIYRTSYIEGYWQSENYFFDVINEIRRDLKIVSSIDKKNDFIANKIKDTNSIAVHLRFFNDFENGDSINISKVYYDSAIELMEKKFPNSVFFVFSDFPKKAKEKLQTKKSKIYFVNNNNIKNKAYKDLWLMTQCKHHIISNSTFSWWGAWLSQNQSKIIIAPEVKIEGNNKIAWWGFDGLIPNNWIKL